MKLDRDLIGFPACLLIVASCCYALIKLTKSLPTGSDEAIFASVLIIGGIGAPLFFGTLLAIVALCMWMATGDRKP